MINTAKDKTKIYVFHYKPEQILITEPEYIQIWAGKNDEQEIEGFVGDDSGDNISSKNKYYSELTGLYWIWKNTKSDVFGSCHYRRYFTAKPEPFRYKAKRLLYFISGIYKRYGLIYTKNTDFFIDRIINRKEIEHLLQNYDAILPQARKLKYTVKKQYSRYHDINDLKIIESILNEKYPDYLTAFHEVLQCKRLYANNMFILKNEHFQKFMTWWFDVLFEYEKRIDLNTYTGYQERIFGFMGERLLNVWFQKQQLSTIDLPLIYFRHLKLK